MPLGRHAEQHLEQLDGRLAVGRSLGTLDLRQCLQVAREPALDRLDDRLAPFRALEALRQRAHVPEPFDCGWRLHRDVTDDVILEYASPRHIAGLSLALAPGRDLDEDG